MRPLRVLTALVAGMLSLSAYAVPLPYNDTQTVAGPINAPGPYVINFSTPTFVPLTDATLTTTSLGDWSFAGSGGALASSESMSVTLDGNLIIDDLFHLTANLDAGSPAKNDNTQAIFQTVTIPQALLATLVGDGALQLVYTPRPEVNISNASSFITAEISYRYDDEGQAPIPGSLALLGLGVAGLGFQHRRMTKRA